MKQSKIEKGIKTYLDANAPEFGVTCPALKILGTRLVLVVTTV